MSYISRRMESDIFYPVGTLTLKVHRNGELSVTENTVYPIRIPGYQTIKREKKASTAQWTEEEQVEWRLGKYREWLDEQIGRNDERYDDMVETACERITKLVKANARKAASALQPEMSELEKCTNDHIYNLYRSFGQPDSKMFKIAAGTTREYLEAADRRVAGDRLIAEIQKEELKEWSKERNRDKNLHDSMQRSKKNLIEYAINNTWTHFATFTVDSKRCDRTSLAECNKKIGRVFDKFRRYHCSEFKYLLIPEKHADGAFHYHGFVVLPKDFAFSKLMVARKIKRTVDFFTMHLGFNDFSPIQNQIKAAKYITKYIEKQEKQGHTRNIRDQIPDAKLLLHTQKLRKSTKIFFRTEPRPEAVHAPADPETGEVRFVHRIWGACRCKADMEKLLKTVTTEYAYDGHEVFGFILGSLSKMRANN